MCVCVCMCVCVYVCVCMCVCACVCARARPFLLKVNCQKGILSTDYKIPRTRDMGRPRYGHKGQFKSF